MKKTEKKPKAKPARDVDPDGWVAKRREHRRILSEYGREKWDERGEEARRKYLARVRAALEAEGFRPTRLQWRHKGHAFGLVKDVDDRQIHVRVYEDGVIDAELEIHRRFLEHLWSPRPSAHREVAAILAKHDIDADLVNEEYLPQVGALRDRFPERRTRVAQIAGSAAAVVGGLVVASAARLVLRRRRRGSG